MESPLSDLPPERLGILGKNLILLKEAEVLASVLEKDKLSALFLKGIALLDRVYECPSARAIVDIDLLVHAQDLSAAGAVLRAAGYAAYPNAMALSKSVGKILVEVDLHSELWFFSTQDFWSRSVKKGSTSEMRILSLEDQFLHCMLHSVIQDGEISEQALADCTAMLKASIAEFSWDRFRDTVSEEGWEWPVALFLHRLAAISPASIPCDLMETNQAWDRTRKIVEATASPYFRMIRLQSRWRRRLRLLLHLFFPGWDFLQMRYSWMPRGFRFLLPALRPLFLLAQYLASGLEFGRK